MEANDSAVYCQALNAADLVVPDGMPLVWELRKRGHPHQNRLSGPDLMPALIAAAAREGVSVGFYGATEATLAKVSSRALRENPDLSVALVIAPPFRDLSTDEDEAFACQIEQSGAQILFVAVGCPKQELWMAQMNGRLNVVMLGVGAAVDFYAGTKTRAPQFMQRAGLEWLHRLATEPRRLAKRYLKHNPRFLLMSARERQSR